MQGSDILARQAIINMRLGVLFSGGKDSTLALCKAMRSDEVVCLITMFSENKHSYMFHTPNIHMAKMQAEAIGLPIIVKSTPGIKEEELDDLKAALAEAKKKFRLDGVVTGGVASMYQYDRFSRVCKAAGLQCVNHLWRMDQADVLRETLKERFATIISGVFAYPLGKEWLGREINKDMVKELESLHATHGISPSGEGGEIETTVLDAPFFKKRIEVEDAHAKWGGDSGVFVIRKARLVDRRPGRQKAPRKMPGKSLKASRVSSY